MKERLPLDRRQKMAGQRAEFQNLFSRPEAKPDLAGRRKASEQAKKDTFRGMIEITHPFAQTKEPGRIQLIERMSLPPK